jgi:hypothetical protein
MKEKNKAMGPWGSKTINDFSGKDQQQFTQLNDTGQPVTELSPI